MQHLLVVDGLILRLQLVLLSRKQIILASHQFYDILQSQAELLLQQVVALLLALYCSTGSLVLLLSGLCVQPVVLYCRVQRLLLVEQVELCGLLLYLSLVDRCLGRTSVEDGHAD